MTQWQGGSGGAHEGGCALASGTAGHTRRAPHASPPAPPASRSLQAGRLGACGVADGRGAGRVARDRHASRRRAWVEYPDAGGLRRRSAGAQCCLRPLGREPSSHMCVMREPAPLPRIHASPAHGLAPARDGPGTGAGWAGSRGRDWPRIGPGNRVVMGLKAES